MKERPILFSRDMVRAILYGRKTQTRRPISGLDNELIQHAPELRNDGGWWFGNGYGFYPPCRPGDVLWVRETWATTEQAGAHPCDAGAVYRATDPDWDEMEGWKWRPSIHMPRKFARLFLRVESVSVERIQDISEEDAKAEGIRPFFLGGAIEPSSWGLDTPNMGFGGPGDWTFCATAKKAFSRLWAHCYAGSWGRNDWVWATKFSVIENYLQGGKTNG